MSTTTDYINANYDRNVLLFIFIATAAVLVLIAVLIHFDLSSAQWYLLPASWWVGGMMVWLVGKFSR